MSSAPPDPRTVATAPFAPAARRTLIVFGAEAELVLLPGRAARPDRPAGGRPAFRAGVAERILATETLWRGGGLAVTPNRFPFAQDQLILWSAEPVRDHDEGFLGQLFAWAAATGGTALLNGIGAAASIPRAHAHLTPTVLPFLGGLGDRPLDAPWLPSVAGASFCRKEVPFWLVGVRGAAAARARAVHALQAARLTAAWNVVDHGGSSWLFPRSPHETPLPHFPHALGASELWGRWCYVDEQAFAAARPGDLERALERGGCPLAPG